MKSGPIYTIITVGLGREEQRRHASPGAAFEDYLSARQGGWPKIVITDDSGSIGPLELAHRARRHAV